MNIFKRYWGLILIGLVLRLIIAGATFHPDLTTPALASSVFFKEGSLNFYRDSSKISSFEILDDLPLSYLISIPAHLIARPLVSENVENDFFNNRSILFGQVNFWIYLIYAKFPLIFFDLLLGILLAATILSNQKMALTIWMFNPITLWATVAVGQADIYLAFFILLAYFLIKRNNLNGAALALGIGGAIKSAPFLLVPLLIGMCKTWRERVQIFLLAIIPYLVTVIPYLGSPEFKTNALFAPQLSKIFFASLPLSGAEVIFIVPTVTLTLYLIYFSKNAEVEDFLKFSLAILLITLVFTHFHMQWILWIMPFLIIWLFKNWEGSVAAATSLLLLSWILMLFLFESSLQMKLFAPIIPSLDQAVGLKEILSNSESAIFRNLAASVFAGSGIFLVYTLVRRSV